MEDTTIDSVELSIDESDVLIEKPKRRIRDVVAKIFVADDEETGEKKPTGRGRPRGTKASKFFVSKSPFIVSGALSLLVLLPGMDATFELNGETKQIAPTTEQLDAILTPLLRIADRHANIGALNPDAADLTDSVLAIIIYAIETRTNIMLLKLVNEQKEEREKNEHVQAESSLPSKLAYLNYDPSRQWQQES